MATPSVNPSEQVNEAVAVSERPESNERPQPRSSDEVDGVVVEESAASLGHLMTLFALYANIQVQADTNDYNRTSVFTLIQGLLLVGLQQSIAGGADKVQGVAIAAVGAVLSLSWLAVEQRTLLYFNARARILRSLEDQLADVFDRQSGTNFQRFWTVGSGFVEDGGTWFQKFSAQKVLRFYLPLLFAGMWILAVVWLLIVGVTEPSGPLEVDLAP